MKQLLQGAGLLELTIRLLQDGLVLIVQPVAFALIDGVYGLCIELLIVDGDIRFDGSRHFDANETAATAGVGEQIFLVAGTYERGVTAYLLDGVSVRFPQVGNRFLQQMFQETLLVDIDLVKFVNVNQEETPQVTLCLLFALEVDAVRIAETKFGCQQNATKG